MSLYEWAYFSKQYKEEKVNVPQNNITLIIVRTYINVDNFTDLTDCITDERNDTIIKRNFNSVPWK